MTPTIITETTWNAEKRLIVTTISGDLGKSGIEIWERTLHNALEQIPDNSQFKIMVNLHGFQAVDPDAHKSFRTIIPLTLAAYGWTTGYVNLFEEEAKAIVLTRTRGITCMAAAHAHHDETKMELYQRRFSSRNERFFSNPDEAMKWIENIILH